MIKLLFLFMLNISLNANSYQPFGMNGTPIGSNKFGPVFSQSSTFISEPQSLQMPKIPMPIMPIQPSIITSGSTQNPSYNNTYENKMTTNAMHNMNHMQNNNQNSMQNNNQNSMQNNNQNSMQNNNQNSQNPIQLPNLSEISQNPDQTNTQTLTLGHSNTLSTSCLPKNTTGYQNFTNPSEFRDFGSPSDLIPIAWFSVWNQLRAPSNGNMSIIHASSKISENDQKNWRFVFKIEDAKETTFYAVLANSELDVKKHIGTDDLEDIRILFGLKNLGSEKVLKIPYQTEALLHNSPFIPNPQYDPDLDDIDIEELVHNELKKKSIQNIKEQIDILQKKQTKMDEHEKKLEEEEIRIGEEKKKIEIEKQKQIEENKQIEKHITLIEQDDINKIDHINDEENNGMVTQNLKTNKINSMVNQNTINTGNLNQFQPINNLNSQNLTNLQKIKTMTNHSSGITQNLPLNLTTNITEPIFEPMNIKTFPLSALEQNNNFGGNVNDVSSFNLPVSPGAIISVGSGSDLDY